MPEPSLKVVACLLAYLTPLLLGQAIVNVSRQFRYVLLLVTEGAGKLLFLAIVQVFQAECHLGVTVFMYKGNGVDLLL